VQFDIIPEDSRKRLRSAPQQSATPTVATAAVTFDLIKILMRTIVHFLSLGDKHAIIKQPAGASTILMNLGHILFYSRSLIMPIFIQAKEIADANYHIPVSCQLLKEEEALLINEDTHPYGPQVDFLFDLRRTVYRVTEESDEYPPDSMHIYLYWRINIPVVTVREFYQGDVFQTIPVYLLNGIDPVIHSSLS
jgi:hypothetical protein